MTLCHLSIFVNYVFDQMTPNFGPFRKFKTMPNSFGWNSSGRDLSETQPIAQTQGEKEPQQPWWHNGIAAQQLNGVCVMSDHILVHILQTGRRLVCFMAHIMTPILWHKSFHRTQCSEQLAWKQKDMKDELEKCHFPPQSNFKTSLSLFSFFRLPAGRAKNQLVFRETEHSEITRPHQHQRDREKI